MGLVYQGWFIRCDYCGEADRGDIACRPKSKAVADALRDGWMRVRQGGRVRWFCQPECREARAKSGTPAVVEASRKGAE